MVGDLSPQITDLIKYEWQLVRDCVQGEKRMKDMGELYLPRKSGNTDKQYENYKKRAKWAPYVEEALHQRHGMIFRREPDVEYTDDELHSLEDCIKNINCEGDSLYQFASDVVFDNMQTCFGGILVDMPQADGEMSMLEAKEKGIRPFAKYYKAENVKDWNFKTENGIKILDYVCLEEDVEKRTDEFSHEIIKQHRVVDLDENNMCRVRVFSCVEDHKTHKKTDVCTETSYIIINGKPLDYIPFFFMPFKKPLTPIFYSLAELNKHYYMQSADYQNGVHWTTIPTGTLTGHKPVLDKKTKAPVPISLGQDVFLEVEEENAKFGTLQFSGEGLVHCETALKQTEEQVGILGTRSISPDKAMSETSDAAKIHRQGENAKLATYARNISEIFSKVLQTMADWMDVKTRCIVRFNVDFDTTTFDPNMINAIANLSREGKFPLPLIYEALKRGEIIHDITFEQYVLLLTMEGRGITPEEEIEAYKKMLAGEDVEFKSKVSTKDVIDDATEPKVNEE